LIIAVQNQCILAVQLQEYQRNSHAIAVKLWAAQAASRHLVCERRKLSGAEWVMVNMTGEAGAYWSARSRSAQQPSKFIALLINQI
jgi:hypothetical protein